MILLPENFKSVGCSTKKLWSFITRVVWGNHGVKLCRFVAKDYELRYFLHKTLTETQMVKQTEKKTMHNIVQHVCTNDSHDLRVE